MPWQLSAMLDGGARTCTRAFAEPGGSSLGWTAPGSDLQNTYIGFVLMDSASIGCYCDKKHLIVTRHAYQQIIYPEFQGV